MPEQGEVSVETKRLTAHEIFEAVLENARDEVHRSPGALAFSGLSGGLTMGLTGLAVAAIRAVAGSSPVMDLISLLAYPTGFIAVIIGRQQLFTENTLYPVILVLDKRRYLGLTLRLWAIVFACNIVGALLFALIAVRFGAVGEEISRELVAMGQKAVSGAPAHLFWSGLIGGWLIALVAWIVTASHWTIGQVVMVWVLTFVVGVGHFAHCIATSGEIFCAVVAGATSPGAYIAWLVPSTLGNIVGGVVIVSLLNYGQVRQD
jgi:formate/nitrite transporter FocA (FNT family)